MDLMRLHRSAVVLLLQVKGGRLRIDGEITSTIFAYDSPFPPAKAFYIHCRQLYDLWTEEGDEWGDGKQLVPRKSARKALGTHFSSQPSTELEFIYVNERKKRLFATLSSLNQFINSIPRLFHHCRSTPCDS